MSSVHFHKPCVVIVTMDPVVIWWWRRRWQRKRRRTWVRPIYLNRCDVGEYHTIYENLKHDDEKFFNYARMSYSSFKELLALVQDRIYHSSLNYRAAIVPEERLLVTLRSVYIVCCCVVVVRPML